MADAQPYTLESASFSNTVKAVVTKAQNDMASIDAEIEQLTDQFKVDIQSRQARKADLTMVAQHGQALIDAIAKDGENVVDAIEKSLSSALGVIGKDLNDFGAMLSGKKAPAPQIEDKTAPPPAMKPQAGAIDPTITAAQK